jgi:hypothetical protein
MSERLAQFSQLIELVKTKPPTKLPAIREYEKAKTAVQTLFAALQQNIINEFEAHYATEQKIRNLQTFCKSIRTFRGQLLSTCRAFFQKSAQDAAVSRAQQQQCVQILDDILKQITDLPRQVKERDEAKEELPQVEARLQSLFPAKTAVVVEPMRPPKRPVVQCSSSSDSLTVSDGLPAKTTVVVKPMRQPKRLVTKQSSSSDSLAVSDGLPAKTTVVAEPMRPLKRPVMEQSSSSDILPVSNRFPSITPLTLVDEAGISKLCFHFSDSSASEDEPPVEPVRHSPKTVASSPSDKTKPIADWESENDRLRVELEESQAALAKLREDYRTIVTQLEVAYEEVKEYESEFEKLKAEIDRVNLTNAKLMEKAHHWKTLLIEAPSQFSRPEFKSEVDATEADESDDITSLKLQIHVLSKDRESLYSNIEKLTDENAQLKQQLADRRDSAVPFNDELFDQSQTLFEQELARVYALVDVGRDIALVDNMKVHKEKAALMVELQRCKRDLHFFRELRSRAGQLEKSDPGAVAAFEQSELLRRLDLEQKKNQKLLEQLQGIELSSSRNLTETENRELFKSRLAQQRLQLEMHKMAACMVGLKARIKAASNGRVSPRSPDVRDLEDQLQTFKQSYEKTLEWGYGQQAALFAEQAKSSVLEIELSAIRRTSTVDASCLDPMKEQAASLQAMRTENASLKAAISELYREVTGLPATDREASDLLCYILSHIRQKC